MSFRESKSRSISQCTWRSVPSGSFGIQKVVLQNVVLTLLSRDPSISNSQEIMVLYVTLQADGIQSYQS